MKLILKIVIFLLIIVISYSFVIEPIFYRLERNEQEKFLKLIFDEKELIPFKNILGFQDKLLDKKTYLVPEISIKISNENLNIKRYIIPFQFNLINNNFFDNGIDTIFNSLNIEETTPEEFNLKASILEEIEKQIDNPRFQENGDIILGFDFENKKNKVYIDSNDDYLTSYEWDSDTKKNLFFREYKFSNNNKIYEDFINNFLESTKNNLLKLFPISNINKILYRMKYTLNKSTNESTNELINENINCDLDNKQDNINNQIDSIHINLNEFININKDTQDILKNIMLDFKIEENDINNYLSKIQDKEISWFSINNNNDKYSINIYIRNNNKYDKIMQKIQLPFLIFKSISSENISSEM